MRKELLSSLELAKSSLRSDIENLEKSLNCEKEAHCETKNRLMLQEHECATLRVDRRRYVSFKFVFRGFFEFFELMWISPVAVVDW